ncbi:MAG: VWA domain-containing protein [Nitrospinae bacterium]|nr:VWA domain-containing protein [Nitrospinota bacterium]
MRFHDPQFALLLLIIPLAAGLAVWGLRRNAGALSSMFTPKLMGRIVERGPFGKGYLTVATLCVVAALVVVSLMRPQYGVKPTEITRAGIDIMILLDTSQSMASRDIKPSRFERARHEVSRLISELEGNRMGLMVFAGRSFVECPLTTDVSTLRLFLDSVDLSAVPVPGTAIGEAVRGASAAFGKSKAKTRAVILVTDGEDLEGEAAEAAKIAAQSGIVIFPVGIGSPSGAPVPETDDKGNVTGYKTDENGDTVISRLDADSLKEIARATGGAFHATTGESLDLTSLVDTLKGLEKTDITSQEFTEYEDRYQPLTLAALLVSLLEWVFMFRGAALARARATSTKSAV